MHLGALLTAGAAAAALTLAAVPSIAREPAPAARAEAVRFSPTERPDPAQVLAVLERANNAQIAAMRAEPLPLSTGGALDSISSNWVAATFYIGASRLQRVTGDEDALAFLSAAAEHYNYAVRGARAPRFMLNADDLTIGDLYQDLYIRRHQPGIIMPLDQRLRWTLPHLSVEPAPPRLVWWWVDALYMAPAVYARQSAITGDLSYIEAMDVQWWRTHDRMWDAEESLYYRDERFINRRSDSGAKIMWSRGNGWVIGGLTRVLEAMPEDFPTRDRYVETFQAMSARLIELQRPDGLWPTSLLDAEAFPEPETSGSVFFTYALAWGINHGLLDRETYEPHALRGWAGLADHVLPSGLLGAVQKTGDQPVHTAATDTGLYGTGTFLLAGLEIMDLGEPVQALPEPIPPKDVVDNHSYAPPPPGPAPTTEQERIEAERRAEEMATIAQLNYDPEDPEAPAPEFHD